ncbi:MAG: inorganic diphosphatase [Acidobacteria bacterium]|nr:inorganic diphosphatase [Acidobacteriota bacterium]
MENAPQVTVLIEVPKGSVIKRRSSGRVDFISPVPCPFNYGSIDSLTGPDGDFLDAAVLGPRLPRDTRLKVPVVGAVRITDRGMADDKLICSARPVGALKRALILCFFKFYARCKGLINFWRGYGGPNRCDGWQDPGDALKRAEIRSAGGIGDPRRKK